jgi:hypothetical protein
MIEKRWSYKQITAQAEAAILRSIALAEEASCSQEQNEHLCVAYGIFVGWNNLTIEWQELEDSERLEKLALAEGGAA